MPNAQSSSMVRAWLAALAVLVGSLGLAGPCPAAAAGASVPASIFAPAAPQAAAAAAGTSGAPPATQASTAPRVEAIAAAEITMRADADEQFVRTVMKSLRAGDELQQLQQEIARQTSAVDQLARQAGGDDLALLSVNRLESLQRHWQLLIQQVADLRARLAQLTRARSEDAASLAERRAAWQATRLATPDLASALLQRVDELIAQTEQAEQAISPPLARLLDFGREAENLDARAQADAAAVLRQIDEQDHRLLLIDSPPLWQGRSDGSVATPMRLGLDRNVAIEASFARDYNDVNAALMRLLMVIGVLLLPLFLWLRHRAERLIAQDPGGAESLRPLTRPWAAWLVLLALSSIWFDLHGPTARQQVVMLLAWLPVLRLLPRQMARGVGPWAYLSAAFYLLNLSASLLAPSEFVYRAILLVMDLLMLATLLWLLRRARSAPADSLPLVRRRLRLSLFGFAAVAMAVALVSNVIGNASLATMLTAAVLDSTYLVLSMYAAATVLVALFRVLRGQPSASRRATPTGSLLDAAAKLGRFLLALACLLIVLNAFRIYRPLADLLAQALGHSFRFGEVTLSPGNVLAFVAAAWLAFWLARMVRLLLAEELLPSMALPSGVGNSISTLSYYTVLCLGLLTALAVLGFPLGRLALVFGALGVGIGFGLQDVVKNFVAGLILMFERPIRPGDVVDVAGMSGTVHEIGMRVTIITTFEGADVVVPNGMLLADKLVNWTLSGSGRRIDLTVGTYPDDPPRRTIELLLAVARRIEGIAAQPAPIAIMTGSGDGILDFSLRAWTVDGVDWVAVRSELALAVREQMADAGIELPRPQSEMHLPALRTLASASGESMASAPSAHSTQPPAARRDAPDRQQPRADRA